MIISVYHSQKGQKYKAALLMLFQNCQTTTILVFILMSIMPFSMASPVYSLSLFARKVVFELYNFHVRLGKWKSFVSVHLFEEKTSPVLQFTQRRWEQWQHYIMKINQEPHKKDDANGRRVYEVERAEKLGPTQRNYFSFRRGQDGLDINQKMQNTQNSSSCREKIQIRIS